MTVLVLSEMFPNRKQPTSGTFVIEQLKALRKLGVEVAVISPTPWAPRFLSFIPKVRRYSGVPKEEVVEGFPVLRPRIPTLPFIRLLDFSGVLFYLSCRRAIKKLVRERDVSLLHVHTIGPVALGAVLCAREFQLQLVCTAHGSDVNFYPHMTWSTLRASRWTVARVDRLIAVSEMLKKKLLRLAKREVEVVHNGADADSFVPMPKAEARKKLGVPSDRRMIVFIGNLLEVKGLKYLLEAFARLQTSDAMLYLIGDGQQQGELESLSEQLGIHDRVIFAGRKPHSQIPLWLSAGDCLVMSSVMEGFPTILPEAMMCEVPVVATDVGGISEIVRHRETGMLVPARDVSALASAIDTVFGDPKLTASMVKNAAVTARKRFTWMANAQQTLDIYKQALACKTVNSLVSETLSGTQHSATPTA